MKRFAWNVFNGFQFGSGFAVCAVAILMLLAEFWIRGLIALATGVAIWVMARMTRRLIQGGEV